METLTCETCGEAWERPVKRGRKPKHCPACRDTGAVLSADDNLVPVGTVESLEITGSAFMEATGGTVYIDRDPENTAQDYSHVPELDPQVGWNGNLYYDGIILNNEFVGAGTVVKIKGESGEYKISKLIDQTNIHKLAVDLIGISGTYNGKHRSVNPGRVVYKKKRKKS